MTNIPFSQIGHAFGIAGQCLGGEPYGSGHINDTFAVRYDQAGTLVRYIFQRINNRVFKNVPALMDNILRVTQHQRRNISLNEVSASSRRCLTLMLDESGKPFHMDNDGAYWRVYHFIERARTYDRIEGCEQARAAAAAFARFQKELMDLPGGRLHETIPDFHNTPKRYAALCEAVEKDCLGRAKKAKAEIAFFQERTSFFGTVITAIRRGLVPERVTHNDTKLNNVMIDDASGEGVCVIDLDTVMTGSRLYDFGDMVRTGTNTADEDELDLSKVSMDLDVFRALAESYLAEAASFLTVTELELLPASGRLITLEIGMRFLTDYLQGDHYFKVHREDHNLQRCRTQIALAQSIESQLPQMEAIVKGEVAVSAQ